MRTPDLVSLWRRCVCWRRGHVHRRLVFGPDRMIEGIRPTAVCVRCGTVVRT